MSTKELLSSCPKIIAIAKPKRTKWCYEELMDLATFMGGEVHYTNYEGVFTITSNIEIPLENILTGIRIYKFAFAKRLVLVMECAWSRDETLNAIIKILDKFNKLSNIKVIMAQRGASKKYINKNDIKNIMKNKRLFYNKKSNIVLDIEGIDNLIAISFGPSISCGFDCMLVLPHWVNQLK